MRGLAAVVILMGLVLLGRFSWLQQTKKFRAPARGGLAGAPVLGVVSGLGWTSCMGPTLSAVLSLSVTAGSAWRGALLTFAYCLGLGIPYVLVALGLNWVLKVPTVLRAHIRAVNIAGPVMLIALGVHGLAVPTILVLDREGRVSARILGISEKGTLKALIVSALAGQ